MKHLRVFLPAMFALSIAAVACMEPPKSNLQVEMRRALVSTSELYSYVWTPKEFVAERNEDRILSLLDELVGNFHTVEKVTPIEAFEPGFRVALATHRSQLSDVRERFAEGRKRYANYRLRGLIANCASCHSRYEVKYDFRSDLPLSTDSSFDGRLSRGEYLLATRQFDRASEYLFKLARDVSSVPVGSFRGLQALKLWLVIEVRVKDRYREAAKQLGTLLDQSSLGKSYHRVFSSWIEDLEHLDTIIARKPPLGAARSLLSPFSKTMLFNDDERYLVRSLKATSLMHKYLQRKDLTAEQRREATFLLARAYHHIPIEMFEIFHELYLEQCIREFPGTAEAQQAYSMLYDYIEQLSSGSGGLHFEEEDIARLRTLRNLAYGEKSSSSMRDISPIQ